jgi:hypothetical protein
VNLEVDQRCIPKLRVIVLNYRGLGVRG